MSLTLLLETKLNDRCGNMASILEVSPGGKRFFNVFEAAPENEVSLQDRTKVRHKLMSQTDGPGNQHIKTLEVRTADSDVMMRD